MRQQTLPCLSSFLFASTLVPLGGTNALAQNGKPVASNDSFNYYRCADVGPAQGADGIFDFMSKLVRIYNDQDDINVRMPIPKRQHCYVSQGRPGTIVFGVQTMSFYTSEQHFECAVDGECSGPLRGYQADMTMVNGNGQFTVNTNRTEDMVVFCMQRGRGMKSGAC